MSEYKVAIITGCFALGGSFITLMFSAISSFFKNKNDLKLEKMKIFVGYQFNAYNELLVFLYDIIPILEPSEDPRFNLESLSTSKKFHSIINKIGYYNKNIKTDLMFLYEKIQFMNHPDFHMDPINMSFKDLTDWRSRLEKEVLLYFKSFNI